MTNLIANIFTITVLSYWAGCAAYRFGQWAAWVTDREQWPRFMVIVARDMLRSILADIRERAPRGTRR